MSSNGVDYLNIEYLLVRAYDFLASFHLSAQLPSWVAGTTTTIVIVGMTLSFILLLLIVYAQIRLLQVEHAGFHAKEKHAHEHEEEPAKPEGSSRWEHIVALATSQNPSDWRRAILEADIMMGDALDAAGYVGVSVGEQLKIANPLQLSSLRNAWDAHMLRNQIAHSGESLELSSRDIQMAITNYKRVLEELGAI